MDNREKAKAVVHKHIQGAWRQALGGGSDSANRYEALIDDIAAFLSAESSGSVKEGHVRGDHGTDFKILAWSVNPLNKRIYVELDATALD